MSYIPAILRQLVHERAHDHCEYCLLPNFVSYYPHEVDHILAEKHEGKTIESNLCLSCVQCNRHKGSDLASIDPKTGEVVLLFHPRLDIWQNHFRLNGAIIEGITAKGRATIRLLHMNDDEQIDLRQELINLNRYP